MGKKKDDEAVLDSTDVKDEASDNDPNGLVKEANLVPDETPPASLDTLANVHVDTHEGFDPTIHAIDGQGQPIKRADGTYAKKRGRKAGLNPAGFALPSPNAPAFANAPSTSGAVLTSEMASKQLVNMFLNGAVMVFGPEWEAENLGEVKGLVYSLRDYFDIRGTPKFPPELGLFIAFGAYALPRLKKEQTKSKLQKWKDNIILFFHRRAEKKAGYG